MVVTRIGNQKHYQARGDSPVFTELHGLTVKTVGLVDPLRRALASKAGDILAAFVYGSVAKKRDHASSDIDLLIVSDVLTYPDVFEALQAAESVLGRRVQPTVMTLADWRNDGLADSLAARIAAGPRLFVIGSDDDLR